MPNEYFKFKHFIIHQDRCAMKVTTDACLFGGFVARKIKNLKSKNKNALDIGTGTGLLALMIAQKNPELSIDAIEIDKDSYRQAVENTVASPWSQNINLLHGNVKEFKLAATYAIIFSNPPFYEGELKGDNSKKNIAYHGEELLLKELLIVIKENLDPAGIFYLLLPYKRNTEIKNLFLKNEFDISQMTLIRQSVNHDYFRIILEGRFNSGIKGETNIDELSIRDEKQEYSPEFIDLLKDYYLNL